jgi:signal transduction histidine kinase
MQTGNKRLFAIVVFTAVLIILVNLSWWYYYTQTRSLLENELHRRMTALSRVAVSALHPTLVDSLLVDNPKAYVEVADLLEEIRSADSLSELFILDSDFHYLATTAIDADSVYFLTALNGSFIDSLFFSLSLDPIVTPAYRTGTILLKSVFAPLYSSEGFPAAVLGAEAPVDYFDSLDDLKNNLGYSSAISAFGGLLLGLFFILVQRRINKTEQQLFLGQPHTHLGRMVAVVAHELKNPLMIVRASAERLRKKTEATEVEYIVEEIDRLSGIVTGYLEFARADGSLLAAEQKEEFDLVELLTSVKKHLRDRYAPDPVEWLDGSMLPVLQIVGYRRSLRQVILNLLVNGAEACHAAGRPIRLGFALSLKGDQIELTISDRGAGIYSRELKRIFAPFYTTKQSGSGLGLYLTRRIVEEMGGTVQIRSRQGEGSEVVIVLPQEPKV